jgi:hypothetical protein
MLSGCFKNIRKENRYNFIFTTRENVTDITANHISYSKITINNIITNDTPVLPLSENKSIHFSLRPGQHLIQIKKYIQLPGSSNFVLLPENLLPAPKFIHIKNNEILYLNLTYGIHAKSYNFKAIYAQKGR